MFDDVREVSATAVFHENVENTAIAVHITVVIAYDMLVSEVF
jgi:hypothetical protein